MKTDWSRHAMCDAISERVGFYCDPFGYLYSISKDMAIAVGQNYITIRDKVSEEIFSPEHNTNDDLPF